MTVAVADLRAGPDTTGRASPADLLRYAARPLGFLLWYVRRRALAHGVVLGAVLAAVACSVGTHYAVKNLIDSLAAGPGGGEVWAAFAVLVAVLSADNLLWRVGGWVAAGAFPAVTADMRADLFRHLGGHGPAFFAGRSAGVLASRVTATANASYTTLHNFTWHTLPPAIAVGFAIALLASVDLAMAAALAAAAVVLGLAVACLAARGQPLHMSYAEKAAAVDGELVDVVQNMNLVRAFASFGRERHRFERVVRREVAHRTRSLRYLERLRLLHAVVTAALTTVLLAWAVWLWEQGRATTGDIVLVCSLGFTILHGSRDLAVALVDLTQYVARLSEALATLLVPHELPDAPGARPLRPARGRVTFRQVSFAYPGGAGPVLRGLDLEIPPGQRVGLVGRSGAGKSTVLALLQRFATPQSGQILVDGEDISRVTQESLARSIAVVPQDVPLLHRSILANIRYGRPDATDAEVMAVAEAACCRDFIEALPHGFDTIVGDRGAKLSGGQRQRIAIARALLKDAPILLLDEATSALDSESEAEVRRALDRLMEGRTVIAVAHRLATLGGFDRIVVMHDGRVVDDGAPELLARRSGPYRELLRLQTFQLAEAA
ncbi:ABC transporter ATP-binding protein [Caldovatus sediminis]|uniref:ABC transporter ATP-binding protein n=1 Tax=Caldovatus sediminis TaxID=2041189 RepID=A0A8J2ZDU0_9PROT|nr:ABC transporter ATP-binding protein [Caldovatus sediminis]GGG44200.1 ABC transporter ATP-binding protein [Caldovatus sediminis]